jgi:hypothetical protein
MIEMGKWKASDMIFVQVWNNDRYEPEIRNYTTRQLCYRTPDDESISLTVNAEEGIVFLSNPAKANGIFENDKEISLFVQAGQKYFDTRMDMGIGSSFVYGYGGSMACFHEYKNSNIEYIPLIFPDNEKFNNSRYREKVERSLVSQGAIFIKPEGGKKYLAVIQRKNKPRDLKPFFRYMEKPTVVKTTVEKPSVTKVPVSIKIPKWLAEDKGIKVTGKEIVVSTTIEKETEKAIFIKYSGIEAWLPKAKITIGQ